jgi:hypothetical protein
MQKICDLITMLLDINAQPYYDLKEHGRVTIPKLLPYHHECI